MSRPRSWVRGAVAAALVLAAVLLALPTSLGGTTGFVTTHGISMEPRFHTGDLAVVRASDDYRVGDVVAYHSDLLDTTVLHRVIAIRDGHYTFQGDNNSWIDPEAPTEDRLIGKLVLRVPQGGVWLARLSSPAGLALLALGVLLLGGLAPGRRSLRTHRKKKRNRTVSNHARRSRPPHSAGGLSPVLSYVALAASIAGLLGLGLGAFAWAGPVARPVTGQQPSERAVTFSYTAQVPPSPVYDDTVVTAPQPVFRALADSVDVGYRYSGEPGTVSVVAELATASGWRSILPLGGSHRFEGHDYDGRVRLDLDTLATRAERAARVIGLPADQLTVTVRARFTDEAGNVFAPELPLTLTPAELAPADEASLHVEDPGTVTTTTLAPRTLGLAGHELTAHAARAAALLLLVLSLLAGGLAIVLARLAPPVTEAGTLRRRYGHLLVPVEPVALPAGHPVVEVNEAATLARIAERYGLLILHWSRGGVETFVVQDEAATYRFRVAQERHSDGAGARGPTVPVPTPRTEPSPCTGPAHRE